MLNLDGPGPQLEPPAAAGIRIFEHPSRPLARGSVPRGGAERSAWTLLGHLCLHYIRAAPPPACREAMFARAVRSPRTGYCPRFGLSLHNMLKPPGTGRHVADASSRT